MLTRSAKSLRVRLLLPGHEPAELKFDRQYGSFQSLSALKGHVVVIDTFAHWCGPCKASFPDMVKMYDDLHSKGLDVVGVTEYYGYFGRDRGLAPDAEYAKMADFRVQYKLPWATIFGPKENFENLGISGIPTAYLIDRSGKVRSIHVGYSPESFKQFRTEVEKLLSE
jgi:thiol-disulfide isomerase/thioredoxin